MQNGCSPIQVGGYQIIRIRPSGEVKTPSFPFGVKIPDVNIRGWKVRSSRVQNGCAYPGCNSYPSGMLSGWNDNILSGYVVRMPSDGISGRLVRVYSLYGFQRTFLDLRFALVIKKLSKHQNLTQFD